MKLLIYSICLFVLDVHLFGSELNLRSCKINPDSTISSEEFLYSYSIPDSVLNKLPFKNQNNLNRIFPGVVSYFQDFYIRGGESYETGFFIDGIKFNDLFTGKNSFFINPSAFEKIEYYNGFIPNDFGNVTSGLYNYTLRTGGDKINFMVEHLNDNITFTNDPYSGKKRLGAYFYGYNETNISAGGPLFFPNVRLFVNANYLFQRDKNPQRYPGVDNELFYDPGSLDSIMINFPEGIVPFNSFESINFLSTLLFDFKDIKIKVSGIYFDENSFVERNHILQYLNPRKGLIDKNGEIINININHKINETLSYSLNANYYSKDETTTDEFLGSDYWSFGDSIANANAGVIWQRENQNFGRYLTPVFKNIYGFRIENLGYPSIDHQKSQQEKISISGNLKLLFKNNLFRIGTQIVSYKLRHWSFEGQTKLALYFADYRANPFWNNMTDEELKHHILESNGVNNIGYDPDGDLINSGLYKAPKPIFYSLFIDDSFKFFDIINIYLGLKYENYNYDYKIMIDPAAPEKSISNATGKIIESGLRDTKNFSILTPKMHLEISPINNLSLFFNISQNSQLHPFSLIYNGYNTLSDNIASGYPHILEELNPIITIQYEFGGSFLPVKNLNISSKLFSKGTKNLPSLELQHTHPYSPWGSYFYTGDNGSLDILGCEFLLDYNYRGLYLQTNLNYQYAKQSINYYLPINGTRELVGFNLNPETINSISFSNLILYDFSHFRSITSFFDRFFISALYVFNSGRPFQKLMNLSQDESTVIEGETPFTDQLDLKIEKQIEVNKYISLGIYIYVINLLNSKNIYDVFFASGKPDDDGYDYSYLEAIYGKQYTQFRNLNIAYNPDAHQQTFYGPPRQIGFGIKINY